MKERLAYVDQIKGIAIILVVMGHLIEILAGHNTVFEFIYSFHMPLFFIISGYLGYKTIRVNSFISYGAFLRKKFITIMLPFLFWILIVRNYFFAEEWHIFTVTELIDVFITWNSLWFLKTFFVIFVFYGLFHWISGTLNKSKIFSRDILLIAFIPFSLLVAGILFINQAYFTSLSLYSLFFMFGVLISKYNKIEELISNIYVFQSCLVLFVVLSCHWIYGGDLSDDICKILISGSIFIVLLNLCKRIEWNNAINNQITIFGKRSLAIYVTHFSLIQFFPNEIRMIEMNPFILFVIVAMIAICTGYLCIGLAKIMEKAPVLNLLMFGIRNK
jgi:fucose 4-O-acetylase-like acetyltransferase